MVGLFSDWVLHRKLEVFLDNANLVVFVVYVVFC
jgi:hypothetical protein